MAHSEGAIPSPFSKRLIPVDLFFEEALLLSEGVFREETNLEGGARYARAARAGLDHIKQHITGNVFGAEALGYNPSRAEHGLFLKEGHLMAEAPAFIYLLEMSQTPDGALCEPKTVDIRGLFNICFPHQDDRWRTSMARKSQTILGAIAQTYVQETPQVVSGQLPVCIPFADCMGSMVRSIFRSTSPESFKATEILTSLYTQHKERISPLLRSAIEHSPTGAYDMDIKIPPNISMHAIVKQLGSLGIHIDLDKIKTIQRIRTNTGEQVEAVVHNLGHKKGIKLTFLDEGSQAFSVDINPKTAVDPADFRTGPHQSSKKAASLSFVAQVDVNGTVGDIGISGEVKDILDGIAWEWVPTMVTDPKYTSIEQAVAATLSALRVELTSPAGPLFHDHRIEYSSPEMLLPSILEQLFSLSMKPVKEISPYRRSEIVKEWMVLLCMDKKYVAQALHTSGLDVLFGVVEQLRNIKDMSQDEFNALIINNPDFASAHASMLDIHQLFSPTIKRAVAIPKRVEGPVQSRLDAAFRRMDMRQADPRKNKPSIPDIFHQGNYTSWMLVFPGLPSDEALVAMSPKEYWNYWQNNGPRHGETLARACILNNHGEVGFTTAFQAYEQHAESIKSLTWDRQRGQNEIWLDMVASARVPAWVEPTREDLFGNAPTIASAISTHWKVHKQDPFYPQRTAISHSVGSDTAVGLPPGGIRLMRHKDNSIMLILTCPLAVDPNVALEALQQGAKMHGGRDTLRLDPRTAEKKYRIRKDSI
jgi:hypothetical protein